MKRFVLGLSLAAIVASGALAATPVFAPYSHTRSGNLLNKQIVDTPWKVASAYNEDWDVKGRVKYLGGSLKSAGGDIDYSGVTGMIGFGKFGGNGGDYIGTSFVYSQNTFDNYTENTQMLLNIFTKRFLGVGNGFFGIFDTTLGYSSDEFIGQYAGSPIANGNIKDKSSGLVAAISAGFGLEGDVGKVGRTSLYVKYEYACVNDEFSQRLHQLIFGLQIANNINDKWGWYAGFEYDKGLSGSANTLDGTGTTVDIKDSSLLGEVGVKFLPSGDVNEGFSFDWSLSYQKDKVWGEKRNLYGISFRADYTF